MSALIVMGTPVCWGIRPEWATATIQDIPDGGRVIRRRFRVRAVGVVFVKIGCELRKYYLALTPEGNLKVGTVAAINRKEP